MATFVPTKPFHESIIDALKRANETQEIRTLCELIVHTKIPKNHQEIHDAVQKKEKFGVMADTAGAMDKLLKEGKLT